jgi:hypothetical protein
MTKPLRFGDEGTQVSTRETVVAILFTIGLVTLLVVRGAPGSDDVPGTPTTRPAHAAQPVAQRSSPADQAAAGVAPTVPVARQDPRVARVPASAVAAAPR